MDKLKKDIDKHKDKKEVRCVIEVMPQIVKCMYNDKICNNVITGETV